MRLTLDKPVYGGDFLGRIAGLDDKAGKAIFVPLVLPGETVHARLTEEKRSFAKAEVDEILTASADRVQPECPYFGRCGGCQYQHANYNAQLELKQQILRETLARAGVSVPAKIGQLAANPWAYRNRIRMALTGDGELSYRSRRSHDLIQVSECPIAAQILLEIAKLVREFLIRKPCPTQISELELFTNQDESELLLTLFCETDTSVDAHGWLAELVAALPPQVCGVRLQLSDGSVTPQVLAAVGQSSITYSAAGFAYRVDHGAFFQVNRWMIDDLVALVCGPADDARLAWDLYAGVGLFARQLIRSVSHVVAVESAPASWHALEHNLAGTTARPVGSTTLDFLRRNREEREGRPDFIVLDPPRTGLGAETTQLLNAIHAPEMVYVSCDPVTLARDLSQLTQERYRIDSITQVDMFPQTFHMETVVRLRRA